MFATIPLNSSLSSFNEGIVHHRRLVELKGQGHGEPTSGCG